MVARVRIVLIVAFTAVGAAIGYASTWFSPTLYASASTLMLIEQRVPEEYVRSAAAGFDERRLNQLKQWLVTRARLERFIGEFSLYDAKRMTQGMDDAVNVMRERIVIEAVDDVVTVGFVDPDPKIALAIAERLTQLLIDEDRRDQEMRAENTNRFLESQVADVARRLTDAEVRLESARRTGRIPQALQLDFETLQARYRTLSTMAEDARMSVNMERRQIGQQFKVIDVPRVSKRPVAGGAHKLALLGGGVGLLAGLGIAFRRPRG